MPKREDYQLRSMAETDLEIVLNWRNSDHIRANMYNDHIITMGEHQAWFARMKQREESVFQIFEFRSRPVGLVNFTEIDQSSNKCVYGCYIGEDKVLPGLGAYMEFFALDYIFLEKAIRKVSCEVFTFNQHTIAMHKKFGFREEGYLSKHILKNGAYNDIRVLAIFNEDWLSKKPQLEKILFR
ncbi:UDP-4-amino-4 [Sporomusaceae bacterium BoRhaA]|uniref:UDP-4-amino-4, 6-dideoxy-N-acetyl-beta-L-altrosamine N-acetyltransferase n=1 Tax=Pelorhabdus rhamnosifermentans TaxID=2772457 RepID=UPI001C060AD8|nr:UDP-4-amino-4,6-dideoxy-N-acetyl-beta-L-altrosamine N-acetyltransferase [Pelorhabdus rhamnosifermentans]MBU2699186.1 UDP-4-amino-4 [Pelorhabdus rhamnosifermentans]